MTVIDDRTEVGDYPLPNPANNLSDDVGRLRAALEALGVDVGALEAAVAGKAPAAHTHEMSAVVGLVAALAAKAAIDHVHALATLSDVNVAGATNGQFLKRVGTQWAPASLTLGDISGVSFNADAIAETVNRIWLTPALKAAYDAKLAASAYTAADVLAKLLTVDGSGSGLDADKVRNTTPSAWGLARLADADQAAARTAFGLGTAAYEALSNLVQTSGNQTVGGTKTFTSIPVGPSSDPTTDNQLARKAYVDAQSASGGVVSINVYSSTQTITIPAGATKALVKLVGGTGAGNQRTYGGGGGGAGGLLKMLSGLTPGNTLALTIGGGGTASTTSGSSGSASTLASGTQSITTLTANGGGGSNERSGGAGGTATNGDLNVTGQNGGNGVQSSGATYDEKGAGGMSAFGLGRGGTGANGISGVCVVHWFR